MTQILTKEELIQKMANLQANLVPHLVQKMGQAAIVVEGEAKRNCTPGHSDYETMVFPTKLAYAEMHGLDYTGAPYSYDQDKRRDLIHMRDAMYSNVESSDNEVHGIVGNPKDYALPVHEGTSNMWGRPFITDAITAKELAIRKLLSEGVEDTLQEQAE